MTKKRKNNNYHKPRSNPLIKYVNNDENSERITGLKNVIFNAATFSTSFVWLYLLEVYREKLYLDIMSYVDIAKMIDVLNTDIREKKSIIQVYEYLIERYDEGELEGFLTVENVKEIAPMYSSYFENYSINDDNNT